MNAYFGNCINYGDRSEELEYEQIGGLPFSYKFENCLLRTDKNISDQSIFPGCIKNELPEFVDIYTDYHLDTLSPAIQTGSMDVINNAPPFIQDSIKFDLDGVSRVNSGNPDIGAYQFVPGSRSLISIFRKKK
jgi:hypothetical protein